MVMALAPATLERETSAQDAVDQEPALAYDSNLFFFPGMYCPSGFDLMKILYCVVARPHPAIDLGPVDASCPIVLCDLYLPDTPIVYASHSFLALTGYSLDEVLGRNCRFLQWPGTVQEPTVPPTAPSTPSPYVQPAVRQLLHQSVKHNREMQLEVNNFRKDGSAFVNFLSVVPIYWDDGGDGDRNRHPRRHRYSVGFLCDKTAME
ncbi:hypothetical protein HMPREF1624_00206 [Sporothrix schenckii ATCC 58251]|uniref:PAS domain-containing protein n=1 Tax=Sporothrix schenckii (strain ATCC 58251 / de Perez 2211183) TaxID=1391915 RepID=U7Q5D5_SPOS1|nr:hypothetical protein HMPREF1624_00206 [Sporothrix schenckii ATCC 58251]